MYKRQIITIILALAATSAWAQREVTITGDVKDGFLKTPLTDAKVTICRADSTVLDTAKMTIYKRSDQPLYAVFSSKVKTDANAVLVHAWLQGYDDVWQRVNITGQTEVEVPTIEMRKMREMELKEVVVKATRVKMFYRGDTLVYDATAFKLPDGSMLDALIRQMPGVTMNDGGEIFVNGRKVDELMLGSRSFFKGNRKVLLENLPYYTVQNIKVYDKQSDKSKALGYDVDAKQYVMDVNLKQDPLACPCVCPRLQRPLPFHAVGQREQCERVAPHRRVGQLDTHHDAEEPTHHKEHRGRNGLPLQRRQGEEQPNGILHLDHRRQRVEKPL